MKGAIGSVEIFVAEGGAAAASSRRRLTLTIAAPAPADDGAGWTCRVVLADLHRPVEVSARNSVSALAAALGQARIWLTQLGAQGATLYRDRTGEILFELD